MNHEKFGSGSDVSVGKGVYALGVMLGVLVLFIAPAFAQLNLGRILGAVTDQTGGAVVGATVTVLDENRGVSRPLISDGAGEFNAPGLTPGTYTVRAEAPGFQAAVHSGVVIGVGQDVRVDLTLTPGAQTQTVTVTGELPQVSTTNATLGGTLEQVAVEELPVNGHDYQYMLGERPGVVMHPNAGANDFASNGTREDDVVWMFDGLFDVNIYGGGQSVVSAYQLGPDETNIMPLDAIQEVNIIENPKAEYGDRAGAHVNVGVKSGTNSVHGTAYAFGRDTSLNATNPFLLPGVPKAPLALEQYGASLGGPIKKDKIFYFMNYEGQMYDVGNPKIQTEPTTADVSTPGSNGASSSIPDAVFDILHNTGNTGNIAPSALSLNLSGCSGLVGTPTATGTLSPTQLALLKSETTSQLAAGCTNPNGIFGNHGPSSTDITDLLSTGGSNNGIIKFDYHPNDKNSISGDWYTGGGLDVANTALQPYWASDLYTWSDVVRGTWVWNPNSNWVNELRFGYEYGQLPVFLINCDPSHYPAQNLNFNSTFGYNGVPCNTAEPITGGFANTTVSGFTALGGATIPQTGLQIYENYTDSVSYTRGKHIFKFGVEIRPTQFYGSTTVNGTGTLTFGGTAAFTGATALEDFMAGTVNSGLLLVNNQDINVNVNSYAGYVQDDWRIVSRVTLNLGLRYEYTSPIKDKANYMANFDPTAGTPGVFTAGSNGLFQQTSSKAIYASDDKSFGPRFGLAWDMFGNGRTVLRVAAGVMTSTAPFLRQDFYSGGSLLDTIPTAGVFYAPNGSTFTGTGTIKTGTVSFGSNTLPWSIGTPVFGTTTAGTPGGLPCGNGIAPVNPVAGAPTVNPAPCIIQPISLNPKTPYWINRSLGIQHAFTNNLSVDVEYVGSHGTQLQDLANINAPTPGAKNATAGIGFTGPSLSYIEQVRRPYYAQYPYYAAILDQINQDDSNYNALQATVNERVSHGLNFTAGYTFAHTLDEGSFATPMTGNNSHLDYGNSTDNAPQTLTFTLTYLIPGIKSPGQLLQGWQLNSSLNMVSGFSVNADDTTDDISGTGINLDRWTLAGSANNFNAFGGAGNTPCFGVAGSTFAAAVTAQGTGSRPACQMVATVAMMPAVCQTAAAAEPVNPNVPAATPFATGMTALAHYGCYVEGGSAIVPPAQGTFGTMSRDALRDKAYHGWDISVTKTTKFKERYSAQFRAEFFNILNITNYGPPTLNLSAPGTFGEATATPDSGNAVIGNGPRKIQLGLKFIW